MRPTFGQCREWNRPEIRDDAQRSAQPVKANGAGGTKIPPPIVPRTDPKAVNGGGGADTDPDGPTGRLDALVFAHPNRAP